MCGRIVEASEKPCPECQYGVYTYMRLDGGFLVISEWYMDLYPGSCISAYDEVYLLEGANYPSIADAGADGIPVFKLSPADAYADVCAKDASGQTVCGERQYFVRYDRCE